MSRLTTLFSTALGLALLGACSQGEAPEEGAEATAQQEAESAPADDLESQIAAMSGPFADVERNMHQQMTSAIGVDAADSWTRKIIAHHQGAVDMSEAFLAQEGGSAEARDIAQRTIDKQTKEIEELERMRKQGEPQQTSAEPYAAAEREMMQAMMAARRDDISESFLRKMLEHHKGGVALSDVLIAAGGDEQTLAKARTTRADQDKDAKEIEAILAG